MAAADSHLGHVWFTWGLQAGALWFQVAAANPDAAALQLLKAQALLKGA